MDRLPSTQNQQATCLYLKSCLCLCLWEGNVTSWFVNKREEVEEKRFGSCSSQAGNATHKIGQWQTKTVHGYLRLPRVDVVRAWPSQAPSNGRRRGRHGVQLQEDTSKTCILVFTALPDSHVILRCQNSFMGSTQPSFCAYESTCTNW